MKTQKKAEGFSLSTMVGFIIALIVLVIVIIVVIKSINPKVVPSPTCTKDYNGTCVKSSEACTMNNPEYQALKGYGCDDSAPFCCIPPNALS